MWQWAAVVSAVWFYGCFVDLEIQYVDLSEYQVVPLARGAPFPARIRAQLYAFNPLEPATLEQLRTEAAQLANVHVRAR